MSEGRDPFKDGRELRFAPDDQIGEWEEEVERWLPEAVGYSVYNALLTDGSDLTDFMNMAPTNKRTDEGHVIAWVTAESWDRARETLRRYGVDIGPHEGSVDSETNLVSLAKQTLGSPRRDCPGT